MPGRSLAEWLDYIERIHPKSVQLGLERVAKVRDVLGRSSPAALFTVAGTNGKGSTCAMLEAVLLAAGYRVGLYTSPHLLRYNERVRIDGVPLSDVRLCAAFETVERARGEITLTYFEFGTLGAWEIFTAEALDAVILEVGLGGRLDAVNAFDPDCALLTSVDLDHMDYLGDTRERIGSEKAGIFRGSKPAVVADPDPPRSVLDHAGAVGADLWLIGRDFGYQKQDRQWMFWGRGVRRGGLALPTLRGERQLANASAALAALDALRARLPVGMQDIRNGLAHVDLPARFQVLPGRPTVVLDVAHNPQAAGLLAENLAEMGFYPETNAVFGMLRDKDIDGVCRALKDRISTWFAADLSVPRGASARALADALASVGAGGDVLCFKNPLEAYAAARKRANENDRIVVFGSFHTVADVMRGIEAARTDIRGARQGS
ncbi:MAG TPA: bifunctional tetrahydrofolate synthase/dihydrofolate synthase [Burkholderiales bacterium]|nr:bifunctional tetrahydrofolate synthase/dihydrofolate synthase [Burkholderiales bacterium]